MVCHATAAQVSAGGNRRPRDFRHVGRALILQGDITLTDIAMEGVKRGVAALTDLETVAALKQSLS